MEPILLFFERNPKKKALKNQIKLTLGTWHFVAICRLSQVGISWKICPIIKNTVLKERMNLKNI